MNKYNTIIIGGGAAGLMAAGISAEQGKKVLVLEKMQMPGRKLGITGKGRCNITNTAPQADFIKLVKPNGRFLRSSFSLFFSDELIQLLSQVGVQTVVERGGRIFPESGNALEVVKSLVRWCKKRGVEIRTHVRVSNLIIQDGKIIAVKVDSEKFGSATFQADKVIIATGGVSYPKTGSTGDGYKLAESAGHKVNPVFPALVPMETEGTKARKISGLELKNVRGTVWINGKKASEEFGEMSFTDFGITGPIVLSQSRIMVQAIQNEKEVIFSVDLKAALDDKKLDNRLIRDLDNKGNETFRNILNGLLPKILIPSCIQYTKINSEKLGHQINSKERKELRKWLKNFDFKVIGYRPFDEAIITAGGVETNEVHQKTMESKLIKGLHFAGEVLDLDAPTGGYNLQIAFSTAVAAARA